MARSRNTLRYFRHTLRYFRSALHYAIDFRAFSPQLNNIGRCPIAGYPNRERMNNE
jgi:hypothetical protein